MELKSKGEKVMIANICDIDCIGLRDNSAQIYQDTESYLKRILTLFLLNFYNLDGEWSQFRETGTPTIGLDEALDECCLIVAKSFEKNESLAALVIRLLIYVRSSGHSCLEVHEKLDCEKFYSLKCLFVTLTMDELVKRGSHLVSKDESFDLI